MVLKRMRTKVYWISFDDIKPPKNWALPFIAEFGGKQYKITGADYIDRVWKGVEVTDEL